MNNTRIEFPKRLACGHDPKWMNVSTTLQGGRVKISAQCIYQEITSELPADPWQAFLDRWAPQWYHDRYPIRYVVQWSDRCGCSGIFEDLGLADRIDDGAVKIYGVTR